jgi:FtsH-binding integral membrane protein
MAPCLFNFATFTVTISAYPGVVSEVERVQGLRDGWLTLALIALYNFCDLVAKSLPRWHLFLERVPPSFAYSLATIRIILVPMLVFCVKPRFLEGLQWPFVLTMLLALSNGYLGSYFLAYTPATVGERERDVAMTMLVAALVCGLAAGSFIGYGFSALVR